MKPAVYDYKKNKLLSHPVICFACGAICTWIADEGRAYDDDGRPHGQTCNQLEARESAIVSKPIKAEAIESQELDLF